jgi:hypothetical protein
MGHPDMVGENGVSTIAVNNNSPLAILSPSSHSPKDSLSHGSLHCVPQAVSDVGGDPCKDRRRGYRSSHGEQKRPKTGKNEWHCMEAVIIRCPGASCIGVEPSAPRTKSKLGPGSRVERPYLAFMNELGKCQEPHRMGAQLCICERRWKCRHFPEPFDRKGRKTSRF